MVQQQGGVNVIQLNFQTLYEMILRNSFYLPARNSSFCTVDYLIAVKKGELFCPKYEDIRLRPCPIPPTKLELIKEIIKLNKLMDWNMGLDEEGKFPDTHWLLAVLSTYSPAHAFFQKDFRPKGKKAKPPR